MAAILTIRLFDESKARLVTSSSLGSLGSLVSLGSLGSLSSLGSMSSLEDDDACPSVPYTISPLDGFRGSSGKNSPSLLRDAAESAKKEEDAKTEKGPEPK
jgi:hypothetical protein